jgi:hypothetical protein
MNEVGRVSRQETIPFGFHFIRQLCVDAPPAHNADAKASHKLLVHDCLPTFARRSKDESGAGVERPQMGGELGRE